MYTYRQIKSDQPNEKYVCRLNGTFYESYEDEVSLENVYLAWKYEENK